MYKSIVTGLVAQGTTETDKTLVGTTTIPQGVSKLVGVLSNIMAAIAGVTTLESISGILELESDDMTGWAGTQTFLTSVVVPLTQGMVALNPYMHVTDIKVNPGGTIKSSLTHDLAQAINPSGRVQLVFE